MMPTVKFQRSVLTLLAFLVIAGCAGEKTVETDKKQGVLHGKTVAFLITEGFHDGETMFPMGYLVNHGAKVTVIGVERGDYKAYNSDVTARVDFSVRDVSPADFDALVIPGGHSPSNLRKHEEVLSFVKAYVESGRTTAAICHGPQVLVSAGVIMGRTLTGVGGIKDEITGAGAQFEDVEVMVDGNIITSRTPPDLPAFSQSIAQSLLN